MASAMAPHVLHRSCRHFTCCNLCARSFSSEYLEDENSKNPIFQKNPVLTLVAFNPRRIKNFSSPKKYHVSMTYFPPKWWLSGLIVGAPTPLPSSLTPIDSPHRGDPVDITISFGYRRVITILTDRTSSELIDFILFYRPSGIISVHSGGGTNPQPSCVLHTT